MTFRPLAALSLLAISGAFFTGCHTGNVLPTAARLGTTALQGGIYGGQQPITGSNIQLYAVNQTTDGGASTAILHGGVTITTSDASGSGGNASNSNNTLPAGFFSIDNSDFTCPTPSTLVYLTASQGNPGLSAGSNNPQIQELAAPGTCSSIATLPSVVINEITTVGSIAALYPYTSACNMIGAANQTNLANAFALVNQYTNI